MEQNPQWLHLRVWESSERMGAVIVCCMIQHEKGKEGRQTGKMVLRSFLISEYKPILTFSKSLQKIQVDFQCLMMLC